MKNLTNRLKKLECQKGSVFILYSYPYEATQEQIREAQKLAEAKYIVEEGSSSLPKTFISILDFSGAATESKWFYAS